MTKLGTIGGVALVAAGVALVWRVEARRDQELARLTRTVEQLQATLAAPPPPGALERSARPWRTETMRTMAAPLTTPAPGPVAPAARPAPTAHASAPAATRNEAAVAQVEHLVDAALARGRISPNEVLELRRSLMRIDPAEASETRRRLIVAINTDQLIPEDPRFMLP